MTQLIQTKAKAFGTFNSPSSGCILYVDPHHDDEKVHSPRLTAAEAAVAFERGLIEDPVGAKSVDEDEEKARDPNALGNIAAERTAETADIDADTSDLPSALASRESTAWPDAERVRGGAEGYVDGVRHDDNDADAAPAPKRGGRKPASTEA